MNTNEITSKIDKYYKGLWKFQNEEIHIELQIRQGTLIILKNGTLEEFSIRPNWTLNDYFLLTNVYFITYADEEKLTFGKLDFPMTGSHEWVYTFNRVV